MWKTLGNTWTIIGGIIGLVAIIALLVAVIQLFQSERASKAQDIAQSTQIAILNEQLKVQREMATLQAVSSGSGPTATAIGQRLAELNSTAVALSTQEAQSKQLTTLLSEDFEFDVSGKYSHEGGAWTVTVEGISDHVLNADSTGQFWSYYRLGLPDFTDGVIEYRVRLRDLDTTIGSGDVFVIFRESPDIRYFFVIHVAGKNARTYFQGTSDLWIPLRGTKHIYPYDFQKGVWYSVSIECYGNIIQAYIDGNLVLAVEDTRASRGSLSLGIGPNTIAQFDDIRISRMGP